MRSIKPLNSKLICPETNAMANGEDKGVFAIGILMKQSIKSQPGID